MRSVFFLMQSLLQKNRQFKQCDYVYRPLPNNVTTYIGRIPNNVTTYMYIGVMPNNVTTYIGRMPNNVTTYIGRMSNIELLVLVKSENEADRICPQASNNYHHYTCIHGL